MDLGLNGKRAIVTGASHGIGLAIVRALADEGVQVIAGARNSSAELDALVGSSDVHPVLVDLSTAAGSTDLVADALGSVRGRGGPSIEGRPPRPWPRRLSRRRPENEGDADARGPPSH